MLQKITQKNLTMLAIVCYNGGFCPQNSWHGFCLSPFIGKLAIHPIWSFYSLQSGKTTIHRIFRQNNKTALDNHNMAQSLHPLRRPSDFFALCLLLCYSRGRVYVKGVSPCFAVCRHFSTVCRRVCSAYCQPTFFCYSGPTTARKPYFLKVYHGCFFGKIHLPTVQAPCTDT